MALSNLLVEALITTHEKDFEIKSNIYNMYTQIQKLSDRITPSKKLVNPPSP